VRAWCVFLWLACLAWLGAQTPEFAPLEARAAAARDSGQLDQAAALYRQALALRPAWAEGWWYLGTLLYDQNSYGEASKALRKAVALNPKAGTALVMLGLCEFELGDDESALRHIQDGNRIGIAADALLRDVILYHEAALLQRKGQFEAAQERLNSLCLSGQQGAEVTMTFGMVALRMRQTAPPSADAISKVGYAQCLAGQKKFEEARREFAAAVALYPEYPNIHYAYGRFLVDAGDTAAGIEELTREIQRDPKHTAARLRIAAALYKVDSAAGLPHAALAVRLDPEAPLGHYLLGLLLLDTDDYLGAIGELEIARKAFPQEGKVLLALAAAYARAGRPEDAERARKEFQRIGQPSNGKERPE